MNLNAIIFLLPVWRWTNVDFIAVGAPWMAYSFHQIHLNVPRAQLYKWYNNNANAKHTIAHTLSCVYLHTYMNVHQLSAINGLAYDCCGCVASLCFFYIWILKHRNKIAFQSDINPACVQHIKRRGTFILLI